MGQSFSLGRISGIRIGVNWSVLVIVALLAYGLAAGQFPAEVPRCRGGRRRNTWWPPS
jgi:hypothetical protein